MKKLTFFIFGFIFTNVFSQKHCVSFNAGPSFNGNQDDIGLHYSFEYQKHIKESKLFYEIGITGTIHSGNAHPLWFEYPLGSGKIYNASLYFTIAGVQINTNVGINLLKGKKNELSFALGPFIRYQSNSLPNIHEIWYPALTNLPIPVTIPLYDEPTEMINFGVSPNITYSYTFNNNFLIGINFGSQYDSYEDIIHFSTIKFGKRF